MLVDEFPKLHMHLVSCLYSNNDLPCQSTLDIKGTVWHRCIIPKGKYTTRTYQTYTHMTPFLHPERLCDPINELLAILLQNMDWTIVRSDLRTVKVKCPLFELVYRARCRVLCWSCTVSVGCVQWALVVRSECWLCVVSVGCVVRIGCAQIVLVVCSECWLCVVRVGCV